MNKLQWHTFEKKIYIHSSLEKLYKLWASEEGITSWFLEKAEFKNKNGKVKAAKEMVNPGDRYTWYWHNWDGKAEGEITKANGKDFIEFSFEGSMVAVKFEERNNVVVVTLTQFEIPEDDESKLKIHFGCSNGWTFWLTNLKAYVEHGILLNETEINLKENELSGYVFVNM
ncbi:SRPBCC domain-containing protein [Lacinutrix iliipiscaria]|uniref:SRPBCC domain-containing protein n=1 Tax=Lacinutrix iliipiscaria TaxID=1230532 RepID=A0ABW5WP21_9FLAO